MRIPILFLALSLTINSFAGGKPRNPIVDIILQVSPDFMPECDSVVAIGFILKYKNGKQRKTKGLSNGSRSWQKFDVDINYGTFDEGLLHINRAAIDKARCIPISVTPKKQPGYNKSFTLDIPYITSIELEYDSTAILAPGYGIPYWIKATYSSGKFVCSKHKGHKGKDGFYISRDDYAILSPDPLIITDETVTLPMSDSIIYKSIILQAHQRVYPFLNCELELPINYEAEYYIDYRGAFGQHGASGFHGEDRGVGDGGDGYSGEDGQNGEDGIDIEIYAVDTIPWDGNTLVKFAFVSDDDTEVVIVDVNGGKLHLLCNGGDGGNGGEGGRGGNGGDETCDYSAGQGGDGGDGGNGGHGGDGGDVAIYVPPGFDYDSSLIVIEAKGGKAGLGGEGGRKGRGGVLLEEDDDNDGGSLLVAIIKGLIDVVLTFNNGDNGMDGVSGRNGEDGVVRVLYDSTQTFEHY